jgi:hydrogenase expression/formation protein HypD
MFAKRARESASGLDCEIRMMEVCGGHTHTIAKYGLQSLLPERVSFIHGPGCPVCVMPKERIEHARRIAARPNTILMTTGDMMRVPGISGSLLDSRAEGRDVRFVYSPIEVIEVAKARPDSTVVFFAIGFETTTPTTAALIGRTVTEDIKNILFHINHVLVPPVLEALLADRGHGIDGLIAPSHVSVITGSSIYEPVVRDHGLPVVVSGFEPVDVMESVWMLLEQFREGRRELENQYVRCVDEAGNRVAQGWIDRYFEPAPEFRWRGFGPVPLSSLRLRPEFAYLDAEVAFAEDLNGIEPVEDHRLCICPEILRGRKRPSDCGVFGTRCTPERPMGACMVSGEGACLAYYRYGRVA